MISKSVSVYLIVNGRGDCRVNRRRPALQWDEVAYLITVHIPQGWGRIYEGAELTLPDVPSLPTPTVGEPEQDSEDSEP